MYEFADQPYADVEGRGNARDRVVLALREALVVGRIQPGLPMTLRGLAEQLGVSPMPVREAIRGLAAERAIDISASGRITVPRLDAKRISEILSARALLEPEAALMAFANIDRECLRQLRRIDDDIDTCLSNGDVERYMHLNHTFHFSIYARSNSDVFLPLIESIWLRFGPFMRMIYGRVGTSGLVDHHKAALDAVAAGDRDGFAQAIRQDICEGMDLIAAAMKDAEPSVPLPRSRRRRPPPDRTN